MRTNTHAYSTHLLVVKKIYVYFIFNWVRENLPCITLIRERGGGRKLPVELFC